MNKQRKVRSTPAASEILEGGDLRLTRPEEAVDEQ